MVEELPDGRLVLSTNFPSERPTSQMSAVAVCDDPIALSEAIRSLLNIEHYRDDPFQRGMTRIARANWLAARDGDDIPF